MGGGIPRRFEIDGRAPDVVASAPSLTLLSIGARYFDALGLKLLRGRAFEDIDGDPGHESAIVNQRFVTMHFGGDDPIGKRIRLTAERPVPSQTEWFTIVGVAPTVRQQGIQDSEPDPVLYLPHRGNTFVPLFESLVVRTASDTGQIMVRLRDVIRELDPDMPITNVRTMDEHLAQVRWSSRVLAVVLAIFAVIALVLAVVGLYAVTAYSVTQRTREMGMRMALGAQPEQIWWLILRRGLFQLAIGAALGSAGAIGVGRVLRSWLVQTEPVDAVTLTSIVLILAAAGAAASLLPAHSATRLDPLAALRHDQVPMRR
jgi:predicted permease